MEDEMLFDEYEGLDEFEQGPVSVANGTDDAESGEGYDSQLFDFSGMGEEDAANAHAEMGWHEMQDAAGGMMYGDEEPGASLTSEPGGEGMMGMGMGGNPMAEDPEAMTGEAREQAKSALVTLAQERADRSKRWQQKAWDAEKKMLGQMGY